MKRSHLQSNRTPERGRPLFRHNVARFFTFPTGSLIASVVAATCGVYSWQALAPLLVIGGFAINLLLGLPIVFLATRSAFYSIFLTLLYGTIVGVLVQLPSALQNSNPMPLQFAFETGGIWYLLGTGLSIVAYRIIRW